MLHVLQGHPRDHNEYVIYDKRRALIEYVVFYSSALPASSPVSESHMQRTQLVGEAAADHDTGTSRDDVSQSGSSSPVSGSSSPASGRSTPHSDVNDVLPITYDSVKHVSSVRQRPQPPPAQPGIWNSCLQCSDTFGLVEHQQGYRGWIDEVQGA